MSKVRTHSAITPWRDDNMTTSRTSAVAIALSIAFGFAGGASSTQRSGARARRAGGSWNEEVWSEGEGRSDGDPARRAPGQAGLHDRAQRGSVSWLPEPERAERRYTVISVDDHIVEPPDTFDGRVPGEVRRPRAARRRARRRQRGVGLRRPGAARTSASTRSSAGRSTEYGFEPTRFDEMRRGAWDIERPHRRHGPQRRLRVAVLPVVPARLRRPAAPAAHRRPRARARAACARGTTGIEEWAALRARTASSRCRSRTCSIPRSPPTRSAATPSAGFKAVTFSEAPHMLGLPVAAHAATGIRSWRACEETGTVVCLHVGSSGTSPTTAPDAPPDTIGVLFFGYAMFAAVDWLYSRIPVRFPDLKICLSRGRHRLGRRPARPARPLRKYHAMYGTWNDVALSPGRHVPPQLLVLRDRRPVGVPAARRHRRRATSWSSPTTRTPTPPGRTRSSGSRAQLAGLSDDEVARVTWANASELFRHPVPDAVQRDPNAY